MSLLLIPTLGSTLLWLDWPRFKEVSKTELLIDPGNAASNFHMDLVGSLLRDRRRSSGGGDGPWSDRWISASWPPTAMSMLSVPGTGIEVNALGKNVRSARVRGVYRKF